MSLTRKDSSSPELAEEDHDLMEAYERFSHEKEVLPGHADKQILNYVSLLSIDWRGRKSLNLVRDEAIAFLKQQRESEYYQSLKAKIQAGEKVTPNQYYYFVLVTDNMQLVDVTLLEAAERFFTFQNCEENLAVVKAALHYQHAKTDVDKKRYQQDLADAIRFDCVNRIRPLFLNLAGIDITGADLMDTPKEDRGRRTNPHLNLVDLSGAKLDRCNMFALDIQYSDLTGASLRHVYGDRCGDRYGPRIYACVARNACFDHIAFVLGSCQATDFTGSSFKNAKFEQMCLSGSIFNDADFKSATVDDLRDTREVSFKNANFRLTQFNRANFNNNDFTGAQFICSEILDNPNDLITEMNRVAKFLIDPLDKTNWSFKGEVQAIQHLIAKEIVRCVFQPDIEPELRRNFLDVATQHRLFHCHDDMTTWLACGAKTIYNSAVGTLFAGYGTYHSSNPAVRYLEDLRDNINAHSITNH